MTTDQPIEVKKDGLRQVQDGTWKLSLTVHPNDMPTALMTAPMGTRYGLALVEIGDDERPVGPSVAQERPKRKPAETNFDKSCRLCGVRSFQTFMWESFPPHGPKPHDVIGQENYADCNERLKLACGVMTKRELDTNSEAARKFDTLLTEYEQSVGRMATPIGG